MKIRPRIPAARLFTAAARHEANYYQPLLNAGQTIGHRLRTIAQPQPHPAQPPERLEISRGAGWYYLAAAICIIGFAGAGIAQGAKWCVSLLPIALIPGMLAWGGLRRSKR